MTRGDDSRLVGWKAIGNFLGRDERTVRRWERERALPINRVPGGGSGTVWASREALENWLEGADDEPDGEKSNEVLRASEKRTTRSRKWLWPGATLAVAGIAVAPFVLGTSPSTTRNVERFDKPAPYNTDTDANAAYSRAVYAMNTRTPAGLFEAAAQFDKLSQRFPNHPAAFTGIAETNLLLREFNALPNETAYRRAKLAAERALAIDPKAVHAKRALGFIRFWSEGDDRGLTMLREAADADRQDAQSQHWYATALLGTGRFSESLVALGRAQSLTPGSSAIAADQAYVTYMSGKHDEGINMLTRITQVDPDFSGAHTYLERLYLVARKDKEFLSEAMISARLKQDADKLERINAASSAFAKGGRTAMFASLIAAAERDFRQNEGSALYLAQLYAAQGDRDSTLLWLKRAEAVRQPDIRRLVSYPDFVSYRNDPAFAAYFPPR